MASPFNHMRATDLPRHIVKPAIAVKPSIALSRGANKHTLLDVPSVAGLDEIVLVQTSVIHATAAAGGWCATGRRRCTALSLRCRRSDQDVPLAVSAGSRRRDDDVRR